MGNIQRGYETGIVHDPQESLTIVDESDQIIGQALRRDVHAPDKGLLHREVSVYLVDAMSRILMQNKTDRNQIKNDRSLDRIMLQSRTENRYWDATAGHVRYDSPDYLATAVRECQEELGLELLPEQFESVAKVRVDTKKPERHNNRFLQIYVAELPSLKKITIKVDEVAEVKFFSAGELGALVSNHGTLMSDATRRVIVEHILPRYS